MPGSSKVFCKGVILGYLSTRYPNTPFREWDQIIEDTHAYYERKVDEKVTDNRIGA